MQRKILVVDDDDRLRDLLAEYLSRYDYAVDTLPDGADLMNVIRKGNPELIVLDIMMPGKNGLDLCKEVRREFNVPIIMLTARGDVSDRIVGLEIGADDYLPKPFEPRELVARIETILRRGAASYQKDIIRIGELEVTPKSQTARLEGEVLELTTKEFEILMLLINNPNRVFSRDDLMESIRGLDWDAFNRSIDVLVSRLRHKLKDDPKQPQYIRTVWGSGYKFIGYD
ncbi:MAG: response regulator transcription factor [Roseivirga sp.]|nr:response regulator transcription factor [Roseivirga sp.]